MRRRGTIHGWGIALACGAIVLCAAPASASTIQLGYFEDQTGYELSYIGSPGEDNVVTHVAGGGSPGNAETITITDTGATIETLPGGPCTNNGPHQVTCRPQPVPEVYPFADDNVRCVTETSPEDCDTTFADRGFGYLTIALNDGDDAYASTPGTMPLQLHVYSTSGNDRIEVSGERFAQLGGGDGRDTLLLGPSTEFRGIVQGWGAEDRIVTRNGQPGDWIRCGAGVDPEPKIDAGDELMSDHGCEEVPEDAVLMP